MSACRLGPTEHDGSRFCHEHAGRVHAGSPTPWMCTQPETHDNHREEPAMPEGLERRYDVKKINDPDGKHDDCRYFVLDPLHDPLARKALATYRFEARMAGFDALSNDLRDWLEELDTAMLADQPDAGGES